jgi:hypothetical protein
MSSVTVLGELIQRSGVQALFGASSGRDMASPLQLHASAKTVLWFVSYRGFLPIFGDVTLWNISE